MIGTPFDSVDISPTMYFCCLPRGPFRVKFILTAQDHEESYAKHPRYLPTLKWLMHRSETIMHFQNGGPTEYGFLWFPLEAVQTGVSSILGDVHFNLYVEAGQLTGGRNRKQQCGGGVYRRGSQRKHETHAPFLWGTSFWHLSWMCLAKKNMIGLSP